MTLRAWPPVAVPGAIALSVVVPLFDESENLPRIAADLLPIFAHPEIEVILVDDGSGDGTAERAAALRGVRVIALPRSGKSEALRRGIEAARGEWVFTIDGDLQEDPAHILDAWDAREGCDAVVGVRSRREDPLIAKRIPSRIFNAAVRRVFGVPLRDVNCGFRLVRREAYMAIDWFPGAHRFVPVTLTRAGFRVRSLAVRHRPRRAGRSKFGGMSRAVEAFYGMRRLAADRSPEPGPSPVPAPRRRRVALAAALAAWAAVSLEVAARARAMWPVHVGDEIAFMPPMLARAQGRGLVNEIRPIDLERDPSGKGRFVHHGFLGAMVVGTLAPPTYRGIEATLAGVGIATLGIAAILFWTLLPADAAGAALLLPAAAVLALATPLFGFQGRPEPFAMLVLAAFSLAVLKAGRARVVVAGVAVGVLGCTHPIACMLAFLLVAAAVFAQNPPRRAVAALTAISVVALVAALPLFLWFPYDIAGWIRGNLSHARVAVIGAPKSPYLAGWLFYTQTFAAAPIFILAGGRALGAMGLRLRERETVSRIGAATAAAAFAAVAWYVGVRVAWRSYDVLVLTPVVLGWIVFDSARWRSRRGWGTVAVASLCLAAFSGGFFRVALIRWAGQGLAVSYDDARARLAALDRASSAPVLLSNSAFSLLDDASGVRLLGTPGQRTAGQPVFVMQAFSGWDHAPQVPGYRLVENHFTTDLPSICGWPLARNLPGYNYSVYVVDRPRDAARQWDPLAPEYSSR